MMLSKKLNSLLNAQVGHELAASHQYVAIATYFDREGLPALAKHYYAQGLEERDHAMRLVRHVLDSDGDLKIPAVPAPKMAFKTALEAVKLALESEMRVTAQINALVDQAVTDKDHLSRNALEWFVNEQREEVSSASLLVAMVKRAGEANLFFVENFVAQGGMAEGEGGEGGEGE
ncbi:MAG: ferritin [Gemmatimonadetes bacterium]|nr:ferritin [Gemmatimonadota bacterium]